MNIFSPLLSTLSEDRYLLAVIDYFTKWIEALPLKNIRANTAEVFMNQIISRHGVPLEMHTDEGKSFESKIF